MITTETAFGLAIHKQLKAPFTQIITKQKSISGPNALLFLLLLLCVAIINTTILLYQRMLSYHCVIPFVIQSVIPLNVAVNILLLTITDTPLCTLYYFKIENSPNMYHSSRYTLRLNNMYVLHVYK